jgi:hypothetical protein
VIAWQRPDGCAQAERTVPMALILLWLLGVPGVIILLLFLFGVGR